MPVPVRQELLRNFGDCSVWAHGQVFSNLSGTLRWNLMNAREVESLAIQLCCPCGLLVDVDGLVSSYTALGSNLPLLITNQASQVRNMDGEL